MPHEYPSAPHALRSIRRPPQAAGTGAGASEPRVPDRRLDPARGALRGWGLRAGRVPPLCHGEMNAVAEPRATAPPLLLFFFLLLTASSATSSSPRGSGAASRQRTRSSPSTRPSCMKRAAKGRGTPESPCRTALLPGAPRPTGTWGRMTDRLGAGLFPAPRVPASGHNSKALPSALTHHDGTTHVLHRGCDCTWKSGPPRQCLPAAQSGAHKEPSLKSSSRR